MNGIAGDPGTPTDGDHWYNTTQKSHRFQETAGTAGLVGLIYANTAVSNDVTGTATETNFNTAYTLPANSLTPGKVIRVRVSGLYTSGSSGGFLGCLTPSNDTLTLKFKFGTGIIAAPATFPATAVTNLLWRAEIYITDVTTGSSGTVEAQGILFRAASTTGTALMQMLNTGVQTVNTTTAQTMQFSATWSDVGDCNADHATIRTMTVEALN
jgi:hypothetical protein